MSNSSNPYDDLIMYGPPSQPVYDGGTTNFRLEQRGLLQGEPDTLAARELLFLWMRSDHQVRNNGYAKTAKRKNGVNIDSISVRWVDSKGKENKKMQALWDEFALDPNLDGFGNLDVTQLGWTNSEWQSGEAFCRLIIKKRKGHTIPLVLQNLPSEYLDPNYSGKNVYSTRNGITFKDGKPAFYHFSSKSSNVGFPQQFNLKTGYSNLNNDITRIDIPADEIIHIFEREKPGQWRGVPKLACLLLSLFELDDLTDAMVGKQKAAQAISWIIRNTNPLAANAVGSATNTFNRDEIDPTTGQRKVITKTNGGAVQYLNRNEDITQLQGADLGSDVIELIKLELHKIAQAAGVTYEDLTGDIQGASFAALQQLAINKRIEAEFYYKFVLIPLGLNKLCDKFKRLAMLYGNKNFQDVRPKFLFPRKRGVNDLKDAQADLLEVGSHFGLLTEILNERNITIDELRADLQLQKELEAEFGISFSAPQSSSKQAGNVKPNPNTKG